MKIEHHQHFCQALSSAVIAGAVYMLQPVVKAGDVLMVQILFVHGMLVKPRLDHMANALGRVFMFSRK